MISARSRSGIVAQNFIPVRAVSDLAHNNRDRDTHATNRGATTEDSGVESDSVKHIQLSPPNDLAQCRRVRHPGKHYTVNR